MNVIESHLTTSPNGKTEECAKLTIDDIHHAFMMPDIMVAGREYTFSCWLMSDADREVTVNGSVLPVTTEWTYRAVTFTTDAVNLVIGFVEAGTYYIYHPQLELGNKATDWVAAPEDTEQSIDDLIEITTSIRTTVVDLSLNADNLIASVAELKSQTESSLDGVQKNIEEIQKKTELKMDADKVTIEIQKAIANGTGKVTTSTGHTFDENGMTISKSNSDLSTTITDDGMEITKHQGAENEEKMLTANSNGVDAKNLHATTYMIVGKNSRFEDFGEDRTGCFWIGG